MKSKVQGFTLVEVLVAIAIFAVLSTMGWMVFDQLIKNRDRNAEHAEQLMQLQYAYEQMLRDFNQVVPIAGQENEQAYPALYLEREKVRFNRAGVLDPLQKGLDAFESVEYFYDANRKAIVRSKQPYIYRKSAINVELADVVLAPVDSIQFVALDPAVQLAWPAQTVTDTAAAQYALTQLPKGVEVTFRYRDRDYRWVFNLVQTLPNLQNTQTGSDAAQAGVDTENE